MASLIRTSDNRFGGNAPDEAPPPAGYRIAPHDPPAGMSWPTWNDTSQEWEPGEPEIISLPWPLANAQTNPLFP